MYTFVAPSGTSFNFNSDMSGYVCIRGKDIEVSKLACHVVTVELSGKDLMAFADYYVRDFVVPEDEAQNERDRDKSVIKAEAIDPPDGWREMVNPSMRLLDPGAFRGTPVAEHPAVRERIEFIRRAAIASFAVFEQSTRPGDWNPRGCWEAAEMLWNAKPEGL